jgi:hypothetical protein
MSIEKCFTISTAHMPDTAPCFGNGVRACSHEYGWIVFLAGDYDVDESLSPFVEPWLRDIYRHSIEKDCVYIVFDRDAGEAEGFKTYEW